MLLPAGSSIRAARRRAHALMRLMCFMCFHAFVASDDALRAVIPESPYHAGKPVYSARRAQAFHPGV